LGDQVKDVEVGGTCSTHGRDEKCIQYLGWKTEGKRLLGRPKRRWKDNIRVDLKEIGWEVVN
jgi:hypothetical protein